MEPAIDSLTDKVESKYSMVIVAARRARQLLAGAKKKVDTPSDKPVTVALQELAAGVLCFGPDDDLVDEASGAGETLETDVGEEALEGASAGEAEPEADAAEAEPSTAERPEA